MKKNLSYEVLVDCMHQNPQGLMEYREQVVVFRKDGINHIARIITYVDIKKNGKPKLISSDQRLRHAARDNRGDIPPPMADRVSFQADQTELPLEILLWRERQRYQKIQIWVTLIANLLLSVLQSKLERRWSFSGLATIVRIVLMYYLNLEKFLNQPDADLKIMLAEASESPPEVPEND